MLAPSVVSIKTIAPGSRIRVLVVDDSVVIRRLVTHALAGDDQIEVVGSASNGAIALQRIPQLKPDILTLDIEMPEMNGLDTLRRIRQLYPQLPVIMFSTLTERGAAVTLEALCLGASDYVTKAANVGSLDKSMASLRSELLPKLKQFFKIGGDAKPLTVPKLAVAPSATSRVPPPHAPLVRPQIVVVGSSTGGPNALAEVMPRFPKNFSLPILIVQHMPPVFTRLLAERLNTLSSIAVEEVQHGARLQPGKALIAAGGFHMRVRKQGGEVIATTDQAAAENSCRPAVDVLFRSVAELYGPGAMGVMLTGMGNDGLRGTEALREKGAYMIAQDEPSSVVWGMPGCVVQAGLANAVLDLNLIVPEILKRV